MDLLKAISRYANSISSFDYWNDGEHEEKATEAAKKVVALRDRIALLVAKVEAAIVLAQFTSHRWSLHKPLLESDELDVRVFDELVKAFQKAEEACNSPAGEGET